MIFIFTKKSLCANCFYFGIFHDIKNYYCEIMRLPGSVAQRLVANLALSVMSGADLMLASIKRLITKNEGCSVSELEK